MFEKARRGAIAVRSNRDKHLGISVAGRDVTSDAASLLSPQASYLSLGYFDALHLQAFATSIA